MGKTIKGITVEINGKTTGLGAALKEVDKQASGLTSNLRAVNKALKLDPTNTELLAEKQKILADSIEATKNKLKTLEDVQDQVRQQYAAGNIDQGAYLDFQKELEFTRSKLKSLEEQQKSFGSVAKQVVEEASKKVEEFGNKVSNVGDKISGAGEKMMPATAGIVALGTAAVALGSDLEESQNKVDVAFGNAADQVHAFSETTLESYGIAKGTALEMASLYGDMATSMEIPQDAAAQMSESLVGLAGDLSSFKNIGLEEAQNALKGIFTGETESLKNLGVVMTQDNLLRYAMKEGMLDTAKTGQQLEKEEIALEKAQTAYNKAVRKYGENSLEAREAALKVSDAEAKLNESVTASLDSLSAAEMVQLRYAYVMEQSKNAQGDFARTSDGAANSMRTAQEAIKECGASFGTMLTPYVAQIAQYLTQLIQGFTQLPEEQKKTILTIAAIVAAVGPVLTIGGKLISGIGTTISVIGKLGSAMSLLAANPVVLIVAGITALIAILVSAYNKCEWFRDGINNCIEGAKDIWTSCIEGIKGVIAGLQETWDDVTSYVTSITDTAMTAVKETMQDRMTSIRSAYEENGGGLRGIAAATMSAIEGCYTDGWRVVDKLTGGKLSDIAKSVKEKMEEAKQAVSEAIDKIMSIFSGFEFKWPKLKLPHFTATGSFSLNPLSVPKIDVSWYAKGGILPSAAIFGAYGGKLLGGGEAGQEAILPLDSFYQNLAAIMAKYSGGYPGLTVKVNIEHFENSSDRDIQQLVEVVVDKMQIEILKREAAF